MSEEAPNEAAATTSTAPSEVSTSEAPTTSAGPPPSEGTVEIGDTQYQFEVICEERGAGEVRVNGVGRDPVSGDVVLLYLQASLGDPYIALYLEDGTLFENLEDGTLFEYLEDGTLFEYLEDPTLFEPSLESSLDLYVQDDVIRASAIRFVRDLDLETGTATEVGFGELEIHCYEYSRESPE